MLRTTLVFLVLLLGCGDTYRVTVRFEDITRRERADQIEVSVVDSCRGIDSSGPPVDPRRRVLIRTGEATAALGDLPSGTYGLQARAVDSTCTVIAAGCSPISVNAGEANELAVLLLNVDASSCAISLCSGGCIDRDASIDAVTSDARTDALVDSAVDSPSDGSFDGGPSFDTGPTLDADPRVDAGPVFDADPTLDAGPMLDADPRVDAGPADAGPSDAGPTCTCVRPEDSCLGARCVRDEFVCNVATPCPDGYACGGGVCSCTDITLCGQVCMLDAGCEPTEECDLETNRCRYRQPCFTSASCGANESCGRVDGLNQCIPHGVIPVGSTCASDAPWECEEGRCVSELGFGDGVCTSGCVANAECTSPFVCIRNSGLHAPSSCQPPSGACSITCPADEACAFGACVRPCVLTSDCDAGESCHLPWLQCRPSATQCLPTEQIQSGRCFLPRTCWRESSDCPSGYDCIDPFGHFEGTVGLCFAQP